MIVTSKINMDLQQPGDLQIINAVQGDQYSRNLEFALYAGGAAWLIPEGADVLIRYCKSDNKGGEYNILPDGTEAWSAEGNTLTVALAPQALTTPGPVKLDVVLSMGKQQISTFHVLIKVSRTVAAGIADSEDYINVTAGMITNALGYTPVDKERISIGIHEDGLLYLFIDGMPVGTGIALTGGSAPEADATAILDSAVLDFSVLA